MKQSFWRIAALALGCASLGGTLATAQTADLFIARMATRTFATTHYVEVIQSRGRWIAPDVYYIDFGSNKYREVGVGGGATLFTSAHFNIDQEAYIDQAFGPAAHGALYLVPWTYFGYRISPRLRGETVYFPYFPLNQAGRIQHILERAKMEYYFKRFKIGAGYAGYRFGDRDWQNKPFLTTTLRGGALGDLEFWLQRLPGNHVQAQIRYRLAYKHSAKN